MSLFSQVPLHDFSVYVLAVGIVVGAQVLLDRNQSGLHTFRVIQMSTGQVPEPPPSCESFRRAERLPPPPACVRKPGPAGSRLPSDRLPKAAEADATLPVAIPRTWLSRTDSSRGARGSMSNP